MTASSSGASYGLSISWNPLQKHHRPKQALRHHARRSHSTIPESRLGSRKFRQRPNPHLVPSTNAVQLRLIQEDNCPMGREQSLSTGTSFRLGPGCAQQVETLHQHSDLRNGSHQRPDRRHQHDLLGRHYTAVCEIFGKENQGVRQTRHSLTYTRRGTSNLHTNHRLPSHDGQTTDLANFCTDRSRGLHLAKEVFPVHDGQDTNEQGYSRPIQSMLLQRRAAFWEKCEACTASTARCGPRLSTRHSGC